MYNLKARHIFKNIIYNNNIIKDICSMTNKYIKFGNTKNHNVMILFCTFYNFQLLLTVIWSLGLRSIWSLLFTSKYLYHLQSMCYFRNEVLNNSKSVQFLCFQGRLVALLLYLYLEWSNWIDRINHKHLLTEWLQKSC